MTEDFPIVVEFRNRSWITDDVFTFLRDRKLGFCCVDEPKLKGLMPPRVELTSSIGYIRFHGRNAQKWWQHEHAWERYHYLYTADELKEWLEPITTIAALAEKVFLFTNNHYLGNAATNARMLKDLLGQKNEPMFSPTLQQSLVIPGEDGQ